MTLAAAKVEVAQFTLFAREVKPEGLVALRGGPIFTSDEAADVIREVQGVRGLLGASSMDRLPTEIAMVEHRSKYTRISSPNGTRYHPPPDTVRKDVRLVSHDDSGLRDRLSARV